jgi:hypothetical protein
MADRIPWFERTFRFDFPAALYPELIERLRGTPARLEDRLRPLPPAVLTRRDADTWSIQENAGHLLDLEALFLGRLDDFEAGAATLRAADLSNRRTHEAGHNGHPLAEILAAFRSRRAGLVARLEGWDAAAFARGARHPRLDVPMRVVDQMFFQAEHDDYHLARITQLIRLFAV